MDSFEEWVKTANFPCFREWGQQVVELGASWDSFRREDKDVIVDDLVNGGIPILAARDIAAIASAEVAKSRAPMAVFWDLENIPIPTDTSGRDITTSLKSILAPHGDLIQFRGYASIGLNHIPQEKRSDLQLSGCHLVDCPHHGRKEVADKMIIVDAMQFAFQHQEGATLCFIAGDVDYAYLLATLQRPQWRTIVISHGTMQSMLHVNCDMKMRWETDILQPIYGNAAEGEATEQGAERNNVSGNAWDFPFRPLSADEGWKDDVELLRTVLKRESQKWGVLAPLKSLVGGALRNTNPARFPQRISIQTFLARAIEEGVVIENGSGGLETLCLPVHAGHPSTIPSMALTRKLPASFDGFPPKVVEAAPNMPYVILLRKMYCPVGALPPNKAFVKSSLEWLFYMFATQALALDAASLHQWLRQGTLVDIRQVMHLIPAEKSTRFPTSNPFYQQTMSALVACPVCEIMVPQQSLPFSDCGKLFFCSNECREWSTQDSDSIRNGVKLVVDTLEFLEGFDDEYLNLSMLGKLVIQRNPTQCASRRIAKLWILEAEKATEVVMYKISKQKFVALPRHYAKFQSVGVPGNINTTKEERFVSDILWEAKGTCLDRKAVNILLEANFPSMAEPQNRQQVFANAKDKELFYLAKGAYRQMVGLTYADAVAALADESDRRQENREVTDGISGTGVEGGLAGSDGDSNSSDDEVDIAALVRPKK